MKVSSINGFGYGLNHKKAEQPIESKNPAFKAKLVLASDAYLAVNSSKSKFERAVEHFRHKLSLDTLNPEDTVILRKLVGKAKEVCTGSSMHTPGKWVQQGRLSYFKPDKIQSGYGGSVLRDADPVPVSTWEKENLEIAINNSKTGFYYNDARPEETLGEDMYNAYKHVRYLEHYSEKK